MNLKQIPSSLMQFHMCMKRKRVCSLSSNMSSFQHDHKGHKPAHEIVRPKVMVIDTDFQNLTLVVKYPKTELLQPPWVQSLVFVLKIHV